MEREEFVKTTAVMPDSVDPQYMDSVISASAEALGTNVPGTANLIIAMEEYAEAQKEISKFLRGQGNRDDLLQELADAHIGTKWVQRVTGISDKEINKAINAKLKRQADRAGLPGPDRQRRLQHPRVAYLRHQRHLTCQYGTTPGFHPRCAAHAT